MSKYKQLAEEVALTALKMRSALTHAYAATLAATTALHHGDARKASQHLHEAAAMAEEDIISVELAQHARVAEALEEETR